MQVGSYLEIFATGYGWAFGNIIGGVLASTGLIMVPFIWIIISTWKQAKERGDEGLGITAIVDTILVRIGVALAVFTLCFVTTPFTSLHLLTYQPRPTVAVPSPPEVSNVAGTSSTYDTAMQSAFDQSFSVDPQPQLAYVPIWWYAIMSISSGVNSAVIGSIGNRMSELRELENALRSTTVEDTRVLSEMQKFRSACFYPARSKFMTTINDGGTFTAAGMTILNGDSGEQGAKDTEWIGSRFFVQEPGYYDSIRPPFPVNGFAIDFTRDVDYRPDSATGGLPYASAQVNPEFGRPTCKEWWLTGDIGLRDMMAASAEGRTDLSNFTSWFGTEYYKDSLAKLVQYRASPQYVMNVGSQGPGGEEVGWATSAGRWVTHLFGGGKVVGEGLTASGTMQFLMGLLPMIQALLLIALYMFLPIGVVMSGFSLSFMFYGTVAIFTLKFWTAIWEVAYWIDARLMEAMYPQNINGLAGTLMDTVVYGMEDGSMPGTKRIMLNVMLLTMFVGMPMVWTTVMGWVGVQMGHAFGNMMDKSNRLGGTLGTAAGNNAMSARDWCCQCCFWWNWYGCK